MYYLNTGCKMFPYARPPITQNLLQNLEKESLNFALKTKSILTAYPALRGAFEKYVI